MSANPDDVSLLQQWVIHHDREAIGELIRRHINFVYATARRHVGGDVHLAEDVTQAVFMLLLKKAHQIRSEAAMTSWLYRTTRYAAANAVKMIHRRRRRESLASAMTDECSPKVEDAPQSDVLPLLDEAIEHLPEKYRICVVLSYLQQKTHRQVAEALGLTEDAARMRVSRAIEKMRSYFASRGIAAGEAALGAALVYQPSAPAGLLESTLNVGILSQSAAATAPATMIAKGVSKMFMVAKFKVAAAAGVAVLFSGLVTGQVIRHVMAPVAATAVSAMQNAPAADENVGKVSLGDGVSVRFAGVSPIATGQWHSIEGKPIATPPGANDVKSNMTLNPPASHRALLIITCPPEAEFVTRIANSSGSYGMAFISDVPQGQIQRMLLFSPRVGVQSVDLTLDVADGPWKPSLRMVSPFNGINSMSVGGVGLTFTPLVERNGQSFLYVSISGLNGPRRLVATGNDGRIFVGRSNGGAGANDMETNEYVFDIPPELIGSLELQTRPYNKKATAKNISLDPAQPTQAQIETQVK